MVKIVSGGQTGVDQAALKVAKDLEMEIGGWCPNGGLDENGQDVRKMYPQLKETDSPDVSVRTIKNLQESDATLIIVPSLPLNITDGTIRTISECEKAGKPHLVVPLNDNPLEKILTWYEEELGWSTDDDTKTLNVAGPRESSCAGGIFKEASAILNHFFQSLAEKNTISCKF